MRVRDLIHLLQTRVENQDAEIQVQTYVSFGINETGPGKKGVTGYRSDVNDSISSCLEVYEDDVLLNIENELVNQLAFDIFNGTIKKEDIFCEHELAELEESK